MIPSQRFIPLTLPLVAVACASAPVKMSHEEAFGRAPPARVGTKPPVDLHTSPQLHAALVAFTDQEEAARLGVPRGAKMGPANARAWMGILAEVGSLLARAPKKTSPFDVVHARLVLQTQLTSDAQLYGDFPPDVADGAQRALVLLTQRLALIAPRQPRADIRRFIWPVDPVVVTSPFGNRVHPISGHYRFHSGLDLLADSLQPIRASYDGVVAFGGYNGSYGNQIELQHDPAIATRYSHLHSVLVTQGERVRRGDVIGLAGSTGQSTGVHLHFELLRNGVAEDPEWAMNAVPQNGTSPGFPQSSSETPRWDLATAWP